MGQGAEIFTFFGRVLSPGRKQILTFMRLGEEVVTEQAVSKLIWLVCCISLGISRSIELTLWNICSDPVGRS